MVLIPIPVSIIMDRPSQISCIPFDSNDWFQYWPSYLSLIATLILDVFAIVFSYYTFVSDKISSRDGTISIDQLCISNIRERYDTHELLFDFELVDNSPLLSYYHQIKIEELKIYICTSKSCFLDDNIFVNNFEIKEEYNGKILPIYCVDDLMTPLTPIISNTKLVINISRRTINEFDSGLDQSARNKEILRHILTTKSLISDDQKMLLMEFSYDIIDQNNYFKNKTINDYYKDVIQKRKIKQYNRIWLKLEEDESEPKNRDLFIYNTCSNVRKILNY